MENSNGQEDGELKVRLVVYGVYRDRHPFIQVLALFVLCVQGLLRQNISYQGEGGGLFKLCQYLKCLFLA